MSDAQPGTPPVADPNNPNPAVPPGTDPKPPDNGTPPGNGAPSSELSDETIAKVLSDPRTYKHERFKKLTDAQKELKALKDQEEQRKQDDLKKKGEFETLANQAKEEANTYKTKYETTLINSAIMAAAAKKGIQDLDAATKLIERSGLTLDENGSVQGVTEALDALAKERPYLLTVNRNTVGSATNPSSQTTPTKFKMSQIKDVAFYRKNKEAIQKAIANNEVEDDT